MACWLPQAPQLQARQPRTRNGVRSKRLRGVAQRRAWRFMPERRHSHAAFMAAARFGAVKPGPAQSWLEYQQLLWRVHCAVRDMAAVRAVCTVHCAA